MAAFEDTFTEASDVNIESHTPTVGTAWTLEVGTAGAIQVDGSNTDAVNQADASGGVATSDNLSNADHEVTFDMIQNANGLYANWFCCVRLVDQDNFAGGVEQDTINSSRLVKMVATTKTTLVDMTHAANDTYNIKVTGTTVQVFLNSVQQGSDQTVSDHSTETSQGFNMSGSLRTNGHFDNYLADEITGGAATPKFLTLLGAG